MCIKVCSCVLSLFSQGSHVSDFREEWEQGKAVISCRRCLADLVFCAPKNIELHMKYGFGPASMYSNLEAFDAEDE